MEKVFGFKMVDGTTEVTRGDILRCVEPEANARRLVKNALVAVTGEGTLVSSILPPPNAWRNAGEHGYEMVKRGCEISEPGSEVDKFIDTVNAAHDGLPMPADVVDDTGEPDINHTVDVVPGYEPLFDVLVEALNQSQAGKGKERHADDLPFIEQPILTIARQCGAGGPAQQVMKKTGEAMGMLRREHTDRAVQELLGAIVYAAATILVIREKS